MMARTSLPKSSIRRSLLWSSTLLVTTTLVAFIAISFLFAYRPWIQRAATTQLESISQQVDLHIRTVVQRTETIVQLSRDLGINGTLNLDDPERFRLITTPLLKQSPNLSSVILADELGREILLRYTSDNQWTTRLTDPANWGAKAQLKTYDENWQLQKEEAIDLDSDPRTSAWFQNGLSLTSDQNILWSQPAVLNLSQEPGLSVIARWTDSKGIKNVFSTELKLAALSQFQQALKDGRNGYVAVLSAEGALLGLPQGSRLDSEPVLKDFILKPLEEAGLIPLNEAYRLWQEQGSAIGKLISFQAEGQPWLAVFHRTDLGPNSFWLASLAPEADFYPAWPQLLSVLLAFALGSLIVTWLLAVLYAKRFSKPLGRLATETGRLGRLELDHPIQTTSKWRELNSFAAALESLRIKLQGISQPPGPDKNIHEIQVSGFTSELGGDQEIHFTEDLKKPFETQSAPIPIADDSSLHLSHAKVLVVEADPLNRDLTVSILKEGGLAVDIAGNGQIAIEKIIQNHYDAVLMDLQMPVMDGLTATHLIRKNPIHRKLPIIAMTANVMKADLDRCRQAGMNDHIGKPTDAARMWQVLKKWIPLQSHPQSQERTSIKETAHVIPNLSRLPGLDFKGSVRRLGGRESAYLKVLQIFLRDHTHAVEDIQRSLKEGNHSLAFQQLHDLKGIAGQVGAQFVEADITLLEKALQSQASASEIEIHAKDLASHYEILIKQLHENLPPPPPDLDRM